MTLFQHKPGLCISENIKHSDLLIALKVVKYVTDQGNGKTMQNSDKKKEKLAPQY
jgi:hypothetical protein